MSVVMTREKGIVLLQEHIKNSNMIKHCLASEAVLGTLAEHLGEDRGKWSMAGLLHDLDVEITNADLRVHGLEAGKTLEGQGMDPEIIEAIGLHNEKSAGRSAPRPSTMPWPLVRRSPD